MGAKEHWEGVYAKRRPEEVSWYQAEPRVSLELIEAAALSQDAGVIDVGGGASVLVDRLLARGFRDVTVLDISGAALSTARERLGPDADGVRWLEEDLLSFAPARTWDLWHDRAVFHFLTDPAARVRYREALCRSVPPGGHVVMATFAPDGPLKCSGLETLRLSPQGIAGELGDGVRLVDERFEEHTTPAGAVQRFAYARLVRV